MATLNIIIGIICLAVMLYLMIKLIKPEHFS